MQIKNFLSKKIKMLLHSKVESNSVLGNFSFPEETDYKIEQYSVLAYPLGKNKALSNDDIRDAIHNTPDMSKELELKQMSEIDFYQLSYEDCLPNITNSMEQKKNKKLIKSRKG